MSNENQQEPACQGVAFEVGFETSINTQCSKPPKRLQVQQRKTNREEIDAKLEKAAEKRKINEKERLERIHERQENCRKMATKMDLLLQQDAKRKGVEGTETIPAMSRKEAAKMIRSVAKDFENMGSEIANSTNVTDGDVVDST